MAKFSYTTLAGSNFAGILSTINTNFEAIQDAFELVVWRDGSAPNYMDADLDMNSNKILNLVAATTDTEPVRLAEFTELDDRVSDLESLISTINASVTSAQNFADDAQASAAAADLAETAAEAAQSYAEEWANKPHNSLVSAAAGGDQIDDYSALHWATEAANSAIAIGTLGGLTDVTITSVTDNELLSYDSGTGEWINQTFAELDLLTATTAASTYQAKDTDLDAWAAINPGNSITWGSGSSFTWTFNAGATDPTLTFASDLVTLDVSGLQISGASLVSGAPFSSQLTLTNPSPASSFGISMYSYDSSANASGLGWLLSRNATPGSHTIVQSGDILGYFIGYGSDGANFRPAAGINFEVDGTPGTSDMPGRLVFRTTSDGSATLTNRWIIDNTGTFKPVVNNTYDIGTTSLGINDLHLGAGGVVNWNNGAVTITESSGILSFSSATPGTTNVPTYDFICTDAGNVGPILHLSHNSASPAASDTNGVIRFKGKDSAANNQDYAEIASVITSPTSTTESASLKFAVIDSGTYSYRTELVGTSFRPVTNDGSALGTTTLSWADLFLASGGVINWNNGNYTLTHSSGLLTASGALSLGTSNALTCGTIELGAASDTTISRASAGRIAVEGTNIAKATDGLDFFATSTSNTIGVGNIELGAASDTTISRVSAGIVGVEGVALAFAGTLAGIQKLTGTGTYTPTSGTKSALLIAQASGGGGGGVGNTAGTGRAGNGGAGETRLYALTGVTGTYSYDVGGAGAGATAGNNSGGTASDLTFGTGPLLTAKGGTGGGGSAGNTTGSNGSTPTGSGGIRIDPLKGPAIVTTTGVLGNGGISWFGMGALVASVTSGGGQDATGAGGGGSGGIDTGTTTQIGGAGSAGFILVLEFK